MRCLPQALVVMISLATALSARAADPAPDTDLQARLDELADKVERLEARQTEELWKTPPLLPQPLPVASPECYRCPAPAKDRKPAFPSVRVTGFFQADAIWFGQDELNRITPVNGEPIGDIQDGADFRRARLAAVGDVAENASYMIEMDFAFPGRPSFMDVWVDLKETFGPGTIRVGQWRQPFSLDAMTSVRDLPLLERALPFAFAPFRQIGVGYYGHSEDLDLTYAISAYRFPTDVFGGNIGDDGGVGLATRWTLVALARDHDRQLLHLGTSYAFGDPSNDIVRYRNQPEVFVSETGGADQLPVGVPSNVPPFVDTGPIPTQNYQLFGIETAGILGSLYAQGEAIFAHLDRLNGGTSDFFGAYAQVGYFLTGEVRPYVHNAGVLGRVDPLCPLKPGSGWGAWEVVGRWSYIDLDDGDTQGNELNILSVGLNWYLNRHLKWQALYNSSNLDSLVVGESDVSVYAMRVQLDF